RKRSDTEQFRSLCKYIRNERGPLSEFHRDMFGFMTGAGSSQFFRHALNAIVTDSLLVSEIKALPIEAIRTESGSTSAQSITSLICLNIRNEKETSLAIFELPDYKEVSI